MLGSPREVNATEWTDTAGYIDAYIQSQFIATDDGEAGFIYTPALYKSMVDNDPGGDGILCNVGDDMANRPVLVDNLLGSGTTLIPGTSIRNQWNSSSATIGGMSLAVLTKLQARIDGHRDAGFSDDIAIY
jgi:hypothetical protein